MCPNRHAQEKTEGSEDWKCFFTCLQKLEMTDMNDLSSNCTRRVLAMSFLAVALASCGGDDGTAPETLRTYTTAVAQLRESGYSVAQGNAYLFTKESCPLFVGIFGSCFGNNSAAPYIFPQPPTKGTHVDPVYAAPFNTPGSDGNTNIIYRLSDDDALITVVSYPPKGAYFGFQSYVFTSAISNYPVSKPLQVVAPNGENPPSRYQLFASVGNSLNNAVVQSQFRSPWDGQVVVHVSTSNGQLADDLVQRLSATGVNPNAILVEKIGANVRTGNGEVSDDLVSLIRYAVPQDQAAADAWLGNLQANVKVYKVSRSIGVSRYSTNRYTPRASTTSEEPLRTPLDELSALLGTWLASVQPTQLIQTKDFSSTTAYDPVTQTTSGFVGSECIENGTVCFGDSLDTYTYAVSSLQSTTQLSGTDTLLVAGVNHNAMSNSSYVSLAVYNAVESIGVASASQTNADAVGFDKGTLTGSAEAVLRELQLYDKASPALKEALPKLYVTLVARDCIYAKAYCVSLQGTALIPDGTAISVWERAYLRPGSTTSGDLNFMLRPRLISGERPTSRVVITEP